MNCCLSEKQLKPMALADELDMQRLGAEEDRMMHKKFGHDLNPFTLASARWMWALGYNDKPMPEGCVLGTADWRHWQRGHFARKLAAA